MTVHRVLPASRLARPVWTDESVPVMSLDGIAAAAMLVVAFAPVGFLLAAALQMFGVHAL